MKKMIVIFSIVILLMGLTNVYANNSWWTQAGDFLDGYEGSNTIIGDADTTVGSILSFIDPLLDMVKTIGNLVFIAVTVILGVKYIWGGVESKASVKDSLMTLIVSALVFYCWTGIEAILITDNELVLLQNTPTGTALYIYGTILYLCNYLAIGGLIYIGIRYMMAGAEGRSQLKAKGVPVVLGIIMVYATMTFLNLIVGII